MNNLPYSLEKNDVDKLTNCNKDKLCKNSKFQCLKNSISHKFINKKIDNIEIDNSRNNEKQIEKSEFGKYGVLNFSSIFNKIEELRLWIKEILKLDINKKDEHQYYKKFIDEFNNAKLPGLKYYDYTKFKVEQKMLKMKRKSNLNLNENLKSECNKLSFDDEGLRVFEKKLIKENLIKSHFDEFYKNLDSNKIEEMNEYNYQNKLKLQNYKIGLDYDLKELPNKFLKNK